jgi:hypothetical protein
MESRQQPRFEIHQEITLTLLGEVETVLPGKVVKVSGTGMCLLSSQALVPGAALKIEMADTLVLGEVIYCRPQGAGYQMGIALDQALYHTRDLATLAQRLLGSGSPSPSHV